MKSWLFYLMFSLTVLAQGARAQLMLPSQIMDLTGTVHSLRQNDTAQVRAFIFLSTECPIARSSLKSISTHVRRWEQERKPVQVYGVLADPDISRAAAAKHFSTFATHFPVLFDSANLLQRTLKPTTVPEVFVLDRSDRLVYRGALSDAWLALGKRRVGTEHSYLREAVEAVLAGKAVSPNYIKPVGCLIETTASVRQNSITYTRHIAPILNAHCVGCHRPGQVAPFSLLRYEDAAKRAQQLSLVTEQNLMPPWIPAPGHEKLIGERLLTAEEKRLIKVWATTGRVRGKAEDLPPTPRFVEGWQLGVPDLIVRMPKPFYVPADGPDLLQHFVIPLPLSEDRLVAAIEFHPGNRKVAHHAVLFLDASGTARKLDAATPEPGYGGLAGPGFLPSGALGGWSVGNTPRRLPNDMGRYVKRGSDLVLQVHYHPSGKPESDQSEVGIYFTRTPVREALKLPGKLVGSIWMASYEIDIPAGTKRYPAKAEYRLPKTTTLVGIVPHMHLLGKSAEVSATFPDGKKRILISIPRWDYNWQDEYYLERPLTLPAGTKLEITALFDNSAQNPSNPSVPPRRVSWGEGTLDEMLYCFFLLSAPRTEDLMTVIYDNLRHDAQQPRTVRRE
jgi:hypothetical protein